MFLFLTIIAFVGACPKEDLFAVGLNAYVIEIENTAISLEMVVENGRLSSKDDVQYWRSVLKSCSQQKPIASFERFIQQTDDLYSLGEAFQQLPFWSFRHKRLVRRKIREGEREVALSYAAFLITFQQHTGVAVKWDKRAHFLAPGMISTAGGSELVADYVIQMWE